MTSAVKNQGQDSIYLSRHQLQRKKVATAFIGRDISFKEWKSRTTSFSGRDISCSERRSRHHSVAATSVIKKGGRDVIQWSRHQMLRKEVVTFLSGRDISCKEWMSRDHLAVTTSHPRDDEDKSRQNKSSYDITETTEVATKNRGRDIDDQMGQLI